MRALLQDSDLRARRGGIELATILDDSKYVEDVRPLITRSDRMPQVSVQAQAFLKGHDAKN